MEHQSNGLVLVLWDRTMTSAINGLACGGVSPVWVACPVLFRFGDF